MPQLRHELSLPQVLMPTELRLVRCLLAELNVLRAGLEPPLAPLTLEDLAARYREDLHTFPPQTQGA